MRPVTVEIQAQALVQVVVLLMDRAVERQIPADRAVVAEHRRPIEIRLVVGAIDNTTVQDDGFQILAMNHNGIKITVRRTQRNQMKNTCNFFFFLILDPKKKDAVSGLPLWISDDLEMWPEKDTTLRFTQIAALHSEFIAVSTKGELHQWRWADSEPYRNHENPSIFHPKTQSLNLIYEKVLHISATAIRCTVSTETNRVATWMDESLAHTGSKLEHAAISFPEFAAEKITSLYTCTLYTVARTENNNLYWWGVLPFTQRKRLWDKHKAKSKKPVRSNINSQEVNLGAQVCMKNSPMYQPGAIGFTLSNGVPKVGQLLNAAWDLTDICRFKIITIPPPINANSTQTSSLTSSDLKDLVKAANSGNSGTSCLPKSSGGGSNKETADRLDMPPPPSPASSTCSDTGSATSHKRAKRAAPKDEGDNKKDEEQWMLK